MTLVHPLLQTIRGMCTDEEPYTAIDQKLAEAVELAKDIEVERGQFREIVREYADHGSVRCGWGAAYGQWQDGDCACGLTETLREAGLPVEWAGGPPA